MSDKFVLVCPGGGISGIFGAGFCGALLEMDLFKSIEAVYGSSCGACTAAFLLAKQANNSWEIYSDDLTHDFLFTKNIRGVVLNGLRKRYGDPILDVNYAANSIARRLNIAEMRSSKVPAYIRVWNLQKRQTDIFDIRHAEDPIKLLRISSSATPYFWSPEELNGEKYIDTHLHDSLGIDFIRSRHPNRKVIVVLNGTPEFYSYGLRLLEGVLASRFSQDIRPLDGIASRIKFNSEMQRCLAADNVLVVTPRANLVSAFTKDRRKLIEFREWGIMAAKEKVPNFLSK